MPEMPADSIVYIVDDDEAVRHGLTMLLQSAGHHVRAFAAAEDFLLSYETSRPACLILDIRMPAINGLELQKLLAERGMRPPIIFLTGHGSVPAAVKALKGGAIDFFQKPIKDEQQLLDTVDGAIRQDLADRRQAHQRAAAVDLINQLTPREKEVMELMSLGKANKVIAIELDISERTVEIHRAHVMKKLGIRSIPELINIKNAAIEGSE